MAEYSRNWAAGYSHSGSASAGGPYAGSAIGLLVARADRGMYYYLAQGASAIFGLEASHDLTAWLPVIPGITATVGGTGTGQLTAFYPFMRASITAYSGGGATANLQVFIGGGITLMTLTTAQIVRTKVQDYPALVDRTYAFDGTATTYLMPDRNLTTASAYVPLGATAWSATGITFDPTGGAYFFANVGSANSAFRVSYTKSTFSDDEIDTFLTAGGSVIGAACQACEALMFDSFKRSQWGAPNGQSYDDTMVLRSIAVIYGQLTAQRTQEVIALGGFATWGLNQADY